MPAICWYIRKTNDKYKYWLYRNEDKVIPVGERGDFQVELLQVDNNNGKPIDWDGVDTDHLDRLIAVKYTLKVEFPKYTLLKVKFPKHTVQTYENVVYFRQGGI